MIPQDVIIPQNTLRSLANATNLYLVNMEIDYVRYELSLIHKFMQKLVSFNYQFCLVTGLGLSFE